MRKGERSMRERSEIREIKEIDEERSEIREIKEIKDQDIRDQAQGRNIAIGRKRRRPRAADTEERPGGCEAWAVRRKADSNEGSGSEPRSVSGENTVSPSGEFEGNRGLKGKGSASACIVFRVQRKAK